MISDVFFDTRASIYTDGNPAVHLTEMLQLVDHYLTNEIFADTYGEGCDERADIDNLILFTKEWLAIPEDKRSVYDLDLIITGMAHIQRSLDTPPSEKVQQEAAT